MSQPSCLVSNTFCCCSLCVLGATATCLRHGAVVRLTKATQSLLSSLEKIHCASAKVSSPYHGDETPASLNQSPGDLGHGRREAKAVPVSIQAKDAPSFGANPELEISGSGHRRASRWAPRLVSMARAAF